jgi:pyrimidine operon attenuation protein/uracil phosphoribosyltransferase
VALVDRGHRELPIKIDYVGKNIPTRPGETVQLRFTGDDESGSMEVVVQAAAPRDVTDGQGRSGKQR